MWGWRLRKGSAAAQALWGSYASLYYLLLFLAQMPCSPVVTELLPFPAALFKHCLFSERLSGQQPCVPAGQVQTQASRMPQQPRAPLPDLQAP